MAAEYATASGGTPASFMASRKERALAACRPLEQAWMRPV